MTKQEADFIGSMNMCDEISNEAYKKIMCNCEVEESQPITSPSQHMAKQAENFGEIAMNEIDKARYCEDAVSRKEVFQTFGELLGVWGRRALMEMPSVTPKTRWIPVSEKLPEEKEFVLVTFGWFGRETDSEVNIDEIRDGDWMISEVVTAWMPLPEPYKAEK